MKKWMLISAILLGFFFMGQTGTRFKWGIKTDKDLVVEGKVSGTYGDIDTLSSVVVIVYEDTVPWAEKIFIFNNQGVWTTKGIKLENTGIFDNSATPSPKITLISAGDFQGGSGSNAMMRPISLQNRATFIGGGPPDYRLAFLNADGDEVMTVVGNNNRVGIGKIDPVELLDVAGNVKGDTAKYDAYSNLPFISGTDAFSGATTETTADTIVNDKITSTSVAVVTPSCEPNGRIWCEILEDTLITHSTSAADNALTYFYWIAIK